MDLPVLIFLACLAAVLFIVGCAILLHPKSSIRLCIIGAAFLGMSALIVYGLDTQCPNVQIYRSCK